MDTPMIIRVPPGKYTIHRDLHGRWQLSHDGECLTVVGYPTRAMAYRCAEMRHKLGLDTGRAWPLREHFLHKHQEI